MILCSRLNTCYHNSSVFWAEHLTCICYYDSLHILGWTLAIIILLCVLSWTVDMYLLLRFSLHVAGWTLAIIILLCVLSWALDMYLLLWFSLHVLGWRLALIILSLCSELNSWHVLAIMIHSPCSGLNTCYHNFFLCSELSSCQILHSCYHDSLSMFHTNHLICTCYHDDSVWVGHFACTSCYHDFLCSELAILNVLCYHI